MLIHRANILQNTDRKDISLTAFRDVLQNLQEKISDVLNDRVYIRSDLFF